MQNCSDSSVLVKMTGIEYKIPDPGIDFAEIFRGSKFRFISQCYNGDGTYGVVVEFDAISNETHEKFGVYRLEARRVVVKGNEIIAIPDWYKLEKLK